MPFSTRNRCQHKSLNWCRVCVFSNTEVTKIRISKSKTRIVVIRVNISTIKCFGSGHIFRVGRGTGNTLLFYLGHRALDYAQYFFSSKSIIFHILHFPDLLYQQTQFRTWTVVLSTQIDDAQFTYWSRKWQSAKAVYLYSKGKKIVNKKSKKNDLL